ncbi:MAG: CotH kinase family protein, partial [Saprospiraceae bacterium]|nr:CotH kinase family protein [Saprospiraceae bacterium]
DWKLSFGSGAAAPPVFPGTSLPLVLIETDGQTIANEPKVMADFKIINKGGGQLNFPNDTDFEFEGKILVELQGFTGPSYPKKNFDFDLVDNDTVEYDTTLLGLPAENDWILKAEYLDPTLMSNPIAYEFARRMGRYAPRTMYCEVFVDGDYVGVYNLTEKVKRDKNRVDIAKLTPQDTVGEELTGGYIIEMNHNGAPGAWISHYLPINFNTCNLPVQFKYVEPRQVEIQPQQAEYIRAYVDSFELSLHSAEFADPNLGYQRFIDDSTFMDFMFVNEFSTNYDSYGRSTFMYKEKATDGGKLKIGPAWDYDRGYCCVEGWVWELTHPGWPFPDWWSILHSDPRFLQQRYCRWQELREGPWQTANFQQMVDSLHLLLKDAATRNFERWPELGYADFDGNVAFRRNLIAERLAWMDAQITGGDCGATAIHEPLSLNWAEFSPNPSNDVVRIRLNQAFANTALIVYDINGRERCSSQFSLAQNQLDLDVKDWMPGIYFVELISGQVKWRTKLVVF